MPATLQPATAHDANVHDKDGELDGTIPHVKLVEKEPSKDKNTTPSVLNDSAGDGLSTNVNNNVKGGAGVDDKDGGDNGGDSGACNNDNQVGDVGGNNSQHEQSFPKLTTLRIQTERGDSPNRKSQPETTPDCSTKTTTVADNNAESVASLANMPVIKGSIPSPSASSPVIESPTPLIPITPLESPSAKVEKIDTKQTATKTQKSNKKRTFVVVWDKLGCV